MGKKLTSLFLGCLYAVCGAACATGSTGSDDTADGASAVATSGSGGQVSATTTGNGGDSGGDGAMASSNSSTTGSSSNGSGGAAASSGSTSSSQASTSASTSGSGGGSDAPLCGNGKVEAGEACDLGPKNSNAGACTAACTKAICGDGLVQQGVEACDDANALDGDGCNKGCVLSGTPVWTTTYDNFDEYFYGVAIDSKGHSIVVGETVGIFDLDIVVRKYDATGKLVWGKTFDSGANDSANGVAVDAADNVFVVGYEEDFDGSRDILLRKLSSAGAGLWTQRYNAGVTGADDIGFGVAIDSMGDAIFAAGVTTDVFEGLDVAVAKVKGTNGDIVWADIATGTMADNDLANAVHIDANGAIVATGSIVNANKNDVWIRKYTDGGLLPTIVWTKVFNGAANGDDFGFGIVTDSKGNVIVSGAEFTVAQNYNVWVGKLDTNGATVWTKGYNGKANLVDAGGSVAVNANGDVVVGGYEQLADTSLDTWVRKFNANGDVLWTQSFNGKANGDDAVFGVAIDANGFAYGAGVETMTLTGVDGWLRQYSP